MDRILRYAVLAAGVLYFGACIALTAVLLRKKEKTEAISLIMLNALLLLAFIIGMLDFW